MLITLSEIKQISLNGVWKQNSSLVQILGMCPLLAITTTLVNGVMLSFATLLVMAFSNFFVACLRNWRAFLVYSLSLALWSALLPGLVLGFVAAIFPGSASFMAAVLTAPLLLVLAPTVVASFYVGYRDILAEGDGAAP